MKNNIKLEKFPNVVTEILLRMKVKDAMSNKIATAGKENTLRDVQNIMKKKSISGIPIVDGERLLGIISVDDILSALDGGYIDDHVKNYMSKKLVVLEDDMPLTFAVSYFDKYKFGRFPVLNKEQHLVGVITSRDILNALVNELNQEIRVLEKKINKDEPITGTVNSEHKEYPVKKMDFELAGKASFEIKRILKKHNADRKFIRRAAIAAYELEINVAIHSDGGKIIFEVHPDKIRIIAQDNGPGIEDVTKVIKEGFSTATDWVRSLGFGAGMGLPNVKKVSDEFDIQSTLGEGTTVTSTIHFPKE